MSLPVIISAAARADVRGGEKYFGRCRAGLGDEFVDEVLATLDRIGHMPEGFGEVADGVRALGLRRFGYVVYYRTRATEVEVLAVLHGSRSPDFVQSRL